LVPQRMPRLAAAGGFTRPCLAVRFPKS